jgi:hypothetical protein
VRSVHPMDPIGSVGRGWLMGGLGPLSSVVSREAHASLLTRADTTNDVRDRTTRN